MSARIFHSPGHYSEYDVDEEYDENSGDENVFAFLPPSTTPADPIRGTDQPAPPQPAEDQQHGAPQATASVPDPSPTFDPCVRSPVESVCSVPSPPLQPHSFPYQLQSPPQTPPFTASHSNNAENKLYSLKCGSNAIQTTAGLSNEVRVSLPIGKSSDGEPSSRPVTRVHEESIVSVPRSAEGDTECCFSEDMNRSMSEDVQVKAPPSIPKSISITPRMLEQNATLGEGSLEMEFNLNTIEESPFPEVRASVSNTDDPNMYVMTIRMWIIGLFLCSIVGAINAFFGFRYPAPYITPVALLLTSYPMGKFLAFSLPMTSYRIPLPYLPPSYVPSTLPTCLAQLIQPITLPHVLEFSLNPGPWNIKEHVLVYIMANISTGVPSSMDMIVTSQMYYGLRADYWLQLVLAFVMQLTGFGLAGLCRRFLVWPASMVWPQNLVMCTLLNTLHGKDNEEVPRGSASGAEGSGGVCMGRWSKRPLTRYRHFIIVFIGSFLFFFLPGYLFEALSNFSFVCWAAPNNVVVNQLFGVSSGLGMSFLTFDWTQITWIGSPLMVPWWAELQIFIGFVLFVWILTPVLYYTNSWYMSYFPISGSNPYDRFGQVYNITRVLTSDYRFDPVAYNEYSPLFLPATFAVSYIASFTLLPCVIIHTLLYHGQTVLNGLKGSVEADDIHAKLMRNYPEVPHWWYLTLLCSSFALAAVGVEVWNTGIPIWSLLLSIALAAIYLLPAGFMYALTGVNTPVNILAEIIAGLLLPGNPVANMVFKVYSVQTLNQALSFLQDLKLGHYMKVPPRATFLAQFILTILVAFVQTGVKQWIFSNVKDICSPTQSNFLTCPGNQVTFTASVIWGLIGPSRQLGTGAIYHLQLYAIIIGAFLPLPFWLWRRRYPQSWVRWVSTPLILDGMTYLPPATGINFSSWILVGFVFQYLIRKRNFTWWIKFNYVTSAALDSGTTISLLFIFFTLQFPKRGEIVVNWWGNDVFTKTGDWSGQALKPTPPGGIPVNF